jgi:hypothetical protein
MVALAFVPKQQPGRLCEEMDGEYLVYSPGDGKALFLNESAALIWNLCDGQRSVQDIIDLLSNTYPGIDMAVDVQATIDRLSLEGIILLSPN